MLCDIQTGQYVHALCLGVQQRGERESLLNRSHGSSCA